ncbi:MAG TPA: TadE/TadG family type IV pilus assembly protein [Bryobacteraceae bacterium]|jgi:Flp pilus assembly protein TadG|nr:TadE/TadG family type IV pilus assembly protein [Bryobacteraceae bacterium]
MTAARSGQRGSAFIEATLVLLFLFALIFVIIDLSWAQFAKATLQHAVRAGVRYAVTGQTGTSPKGVALGQVASIQQVVQQESMGFLTDASKISVQFFTPGTNPPTACPSTTAGCNAGGNLVVVSVQNFTVNPFAPLLRNGSPVTFTVSAGDLLEPAATPPAL